MNTGIFHLTIKNNETGEILRDVDVNCLIGGVAIGDDSTGIIVASCGELELAEGIVAAENAIKAIKKREGFLFSRLVKRLSKSVKTVEVDPTEAD